jgi:FkbM family methyltransferase
MMNIYDRFKSQSIDEHIKYWFPILGKLLFRLHIFRNTKSQFSFLIWFSWIITGRHISWKNFTLSNYGVWLADRKNDATFTFAVEASYINNLERILWESEREITFVDIGSNIGIFSLIAAKNPNIKIIQAFEPDQKTFQFLEANILRNHATKVVAHNLAIGKTAGAAFLSLIDGHSGISRIITDVREDCESFSKILMVNETFLDSVFDPHNSQYFVKIDVEGYEIDVLETLSKSSFFPKIISFFIEFDTNFGKVKQVESFLISNGFMESERWGKSDHWDALWLRS